MQKSNGELAGYSAHHFAFQRSDANILTHDRHRAVKFERGAGKGDIDHATLQFGAIGAGDQGRTNRVLAGRGALILELIFLVIEQPNEPVRQLVLFVLGGLELDREPAFCGANDLT